MKKRDFMKCLAAIVTAPAWMKPVVPTHQPREVWGPMDVYRHRNLMNRGIHLHIYHFNQDVTKRCRFFDDTPGRERAELYLHNDQGRAYLNAERTGPAMEVITSFVIRRGEPLYRT